MKIAVIGAKNIPPQQGGIEHYCAEIYPRIVAQGHSVDLFARSSVTNESVFNRRDCDGVQVISLPCPGKRGLDALTSSLLGAIATVGFNYDIVHFHALGPALFSSIPKFASSAKVVVTCHGLDWQRQKWGAMSSHLIRMGERAAVKYSDGLATVSEDLRSYFQQVYGKQSVYIPNAPATYAPSDPTFAYGQSLGLKPDRYMVFLGRMVPEKCPDLLLRAFQKIQSQGWKLVFVGGNSDTTQYVSELSKLASGNPNVIFTGELRGKRLAEIMRSAGLFVLPSALEGMPLAMLEAMAEKIPVVASDIPPHVQLIGQDRGVLFRSGDLESLERQLEWAIFHPQEMQRMARRSQQNVQLKYTWEQATRNNLKLYESVLDSSYQKAARPTAAVNRIH